MCQLRIPHIEMITTTPGGDKRLNEYAVGEGHQQKDFLAPLAPIIRSGPSKTTLGNYPSPPRLHKHAKSRKNDGNTGSLCFDQSVLAQGRCGGGWDKALKCMAVDGSN